MLTIVLPIFIIFLFWNRFSNCSEWFLQYLSDINLLIKYIKS